MLIQINLHIDNGSLGTYYISLLMLYLLHDATLFPSYVM